MSSPSAIVELMRPLMFMFLLTVTLAGCGGEREGTVKYADCREIIRLNQRDFDTKKTRGTSFTCTYVRDAADHIIGGECIAVETTSFGPCVRAYVYNIPRIQTKEEAEREQYNELMSAPCPSAHEVRGSSGSCVCEPGYTTNPSATACVPITHQ